MPNVPELITLQQDRKHKPCWLAAGMSRAMFLRKFRGSRILDVEVAATWSQSLSFLHSYVSSRHIFTHSIQMVDTILDAVDGMESFDLLSMKVSCQWMLGLARVLGYQADHIYNVEMIFWKQRFSDMEKKERKPTKKRQPGTAGTGLEDIFQPPTSPPPLDLLHLHTVDPNSIRLQEHDDVLRWAHEQDNTSFGNMAMEDLEYLITGKLQTDFSTNLDLIEETRRIPDPNLLDEVGRLTFIFQEPVDPDQYQPFPVVEDIPIPPPTTDDVTPTPMIAPGPQWPATPTKHKAPTSPQIETPSKRARREVEPESELSLSTLDTELITILRSSRTRKMKDARTVIQINPAITSSRVKNAIDDRVRLPYRIPATQLLQRPCSNLKWARNLTVDFELMTVIPIEQHMPRANHSVRRNSPIPTPIVDSSRPLHSKWSPQVGPGTTSDDGLQQPLTEPLSLAFPAMRTDRPSKGPVTDPPPPSEEVGGFPSPLPLEVVGEPLSRRIENGLDFVRRTASEESLNGSQAFVERFPPGSDWVKADALAYIKSSFAKSVNISLRFTDIAPITGTNRRTAAKLFCICLSLVKDKEILIEQTDSTAPIYILPYAPM